MKGARKQYRNVKSLRALRMDYTVRSCVFVDVKEANLLLYTLSTSDSFHEEGYFHMESRLKIPNQWEKNHRG